MRGGATDTKFFGEPGNLGQDVDDSVEFINSGGFSTVAMQVNVPTGGAACFEACFNNSDWWPITLRDIDNDEYAQTTTDGTPFIGSISGVRCFRVRTCTAGSAPGTVMGTLQRGASTLEGIEFGYPPHRFGFAPVHRDVSFATAQTGAAIWTPVAGKKFVLTDLTIVCGGTTDAVVTVFDETDATGNRIFRGTIDVSNNKQYTYDHDFKTPQVASAVDNVLKLTTTANITIDVTAHGYEI